MSSKLNRIVQMDSLIRSGLYPSVALFKERFAVSERAIHDDITYLKDTLRAPLRYSRMQGGYYYAEPAWVLPTILTTEGELLAFFLSAELAQRYLGTSFEAPLHSAIAKLAPHLPEKFQLDVGQITQRFSLQAGAAESADAALLVALSGAIAECQPLGIAYYAAGRGEPAQCEIEPYHLYSVRGDWHVIAFERRSGQFRSFALSNIETWKTRAAERFTRDAEFSPSAYLAQGLSNEPRGASAEVAIWFDAEQAPSIRKRQWHLSQEIEDHADGALTLRLRGAALAEVRRWVLSFGAHAEVLAPEALRAEVADAIAAMAERYDQSLKLAATSRG